jgi:hypothetical protein
MEIPLSLGKFAVIDDADYDKIKNYSWHAIKNGKSNDYDYYYAVANTKRADGTWTVILMHRLILDIKDRKIEVDHISRDGLNNRRNNLRSCSRSQNMANMVYVRGKSDYKGVQFRSDNKTNPWRAVVGGGGRGKGVRRRTIGNFKTETEAAMAYNCAAETLYGEFARLNKI